MNHEAPALFTVAQYSTKHLFIKGCSISWSGIVVDVYPVDDTHECVVLVPDPFYDHGKKKIHMLRLERFKLTDTNVTANHRKFPVSKELLDALDWHLKWFGNTTPVRTKANITLFLEKHRNEPPTT